MPKTRKSRRPTYVPTAEFIAERHVAEQVDLCAQAVRNWHERLGGLVGTLGRRVFPRKTRRAHPGGTRPPVTELPRHAAVVVFDEFFPTAPERCDRCGLVFADLGHLLIILGSDRDMRLRVCDDCGRLIRRTPPKQRARLFMKAAACA